MLESHPPLRFCKPPPELLGQRDERSKVRAEACASARVVSLNHPRLLAEKRALHTHRRNWSGSRGLHPDRLRHRERCCDYTTFLRGASQWRPRQELHLRPPPSHGGALIYLSYADRMAPGVGSAPTSPPFRGGANLSQLPGAMIVQRGNAPQSLAYRASALLLSYRTGKMDRAALRRAPLGDGISPERPRWPWCGSGSRCSGAPGANRAA